MSGREDHLRSNRDPQVPRPAFYDQVEEDILQSVLDGDGFDEDSRNEE